MSLVRAVAHTINQSNLKSAFMFDYYFTKFRCVNNFKVNIHFSAKARKIRRRRNRRGRANSERKLMCMKFLGLQLSASTYGDGWPVLYFHSRCFRDCVWRVAHFIVESNWRKFSTFCPGGDMNHDSPISRLTVYRTAVDAGQRDVPTSSVCERSATEGQRSAKGNSGA